ncbi:MAG: phenylacetate--CoA ligase family protein [Kofleriaceae bacterium]
MAGSVHGIVWPAVPSPTPRASLAIADELERTQWWSLDELARHQRLQLDAMLAHARSTVPHYQGITDFASVPVMSRAEITAAAGDLVSRAYPSTHGPAPETETSRTSGAPVRVRGTGVIAALHGAIALRDHRWHRRDLGAHLAAIRYLPGKAAPPDGSETRGWSPVTALIAPDARMSALSIASTTDEQLAWVVAKNPAYLIIYPSALHALLLRIAQTGARLPALKQIRTISEVLSPGTRGLCTEVIDVPIVDTYSAQEVGNIALQCPDHEHYHVQSERLIVEILRDDGTPCAIGETGRVVVTDLHNFATPILRYDIGDYAVVGAPCACGRGLPVLERIVGRRRNMLVYPDGRTTWPLFSVACREATRYQHLQLVQLTRDTLRARVVPDGDLDREALIAALRRTLGHPFSVEVEVVGEIGRTPAGKLEEFISLAT